jgi:protein gp37
MGAGAGRGEMGGEMMALKRSNIGWCDYSGGDLNFVIGCTPVSEGCANCYARTWAKRAGRDFSNIVVSRQKLDRLWKARWEPRDTPYRRGPGSKPIMFPVDLGDLFHPKVEDDFILCALNAFRVREDADWVLLTKRPERMLNITELFLRHAHLMALPLNIWCLITAENQRWADERLPVLLQVRAQVRGVSLEPMLEPIDLDIPCLYHHSLGFSDTIETMHEYGERFWVIVGAESGPRRRPFEVAWTEGIYKDCRATGMPFFGKQDSGLHPGVPLILPGCGEVREWPQIGMEYEA